jgi:hypothetical protein
MRRGDLNHRATDLKNIEAAPVTVSARSCRADLICFSSCANVGFGCFIEVLQTHYGNQITLSVVSGV